MTTIVLQVQGAEPRCFLLEVLDGNGKRWTYSIVSLSAFDALEQAKRALPREETLPSAVRGGEIERVALCVGYKVPESAQPLFYRCSEWRCSGGHRRIGVLP